MPARGRLRAGHAPPPEINYLAKDYGTFRQLMLDRLALIMPDWRERHVPDLNITLVELLAYVGDYLSYYQDAVATEAYLDTARQRISVRRHARLVDYRLHEGVNARLGDGGDGGGPRTAAREQLLLHHGIPRHPRRERPHRPPPGPGLRLARGLRSVRAAGAAAGSPAALLRGAQPHALLHVGRTRVLPREGRDARDAVGRAAEERRAAAPRRRRNIRPSRITARSRRYPANPPKKEQGVGATTASPIRRRRRHACCTSNRATC